MCKSRYIFLLKYLYFVLLGFCNDALLFYNQMFLSDPIKKSNQVSRLYCECICRIFVEKYKNNKKNPRDARKCTKYPKYGNTCNI